VAADAVYASLREPVPATIYFSAGAAPDSTSSLADLERPLRERFARAVDQKCRRGDRRRESRPGADVPAIGRSDRRVTPQERMVAMLSAFFGALALLLAGLGLFVSPRIGVSTTTRDWDQDGARRCAGAVLRSVLSRVSLLVGIGVTIGTGLAWGCRGSRRRFSSASSRATPRLSWALWRSWWVSVFSPLGCRRGMRHARSRRRLAIGVTDFSLTSWLPLEGGSHGEAETVGGAATSTRAFFPDASNAIDLANAGSLSFPSFGDVNPDDEVAPVRTAPTPGRNSTLSGSPSARWRCSSAWPDIDGFGA
jgi:hypothetical protein